MKVPARVGSQPIREFEHIVLRLWTGWPLRLLLGSLGVAPQPCCLLSFSPSPSRVPETLQPVLQSDVCQVKKNP